MSTETQKRHDWTKEEELFLVENYPNNGLDFCFNVLGVERAATRMKISKLKLKLSDEYRKKLIGNRIKLPQEQIDFISSHYADHGGIYCAEKLGIDKVDVFRHARRLKIKRKQLKRRNIKSSINANNIIKLDTKEACYLLGFLWADGYVKRNNNEIRIKAVSCDLHNIIPVFYKFGYWSNYILNPKKYYRKQKNQEQLIISASSKELHHFLVENDFCAKSEVSPSKLLSEISDELKPYFFRGWFDGDGGISFLETDCGLVKNFSLSIAGSYSQDWASILDLLKFLNIVFFSLERSVSKLGHKSSRIVITDKPSAIKFLDHIYSGDTFPCLGRKYLKFLRLKANLEYIKDNPLFYSFKNKSNGKHKYNGDKIFDRSLQGLNV
jgi:hypothetical protein